MKRETSFVLTLGLLSAITTPIFAQDMHGQPDPAPATSIIGPQLIAWSELQKPRPIPEPVPAPGGNHKQSNQKQEPAPPSVQHPQTGAQSTVGDDKEPSKK
jgi:hypothetical protein